MPNLRGSEWLIIILIVALLFGAKRMPDAARSLGRSLRIFKAETKGMNDDAAATAPAVPGPPPPAVSATDQTPAVAPPPAAPAAPPAAPTSTPAATAQPERADG